MIYVKMVGNFMALVSLCDLFVGKNIYILMYLDKRFI